MTKVLLFAMASMAALSFVVTGIGIMIAEMAPVLIRVPIGIVVVLGGLGILSLLVDAWRDAQ